MAQGSGPKNTTDELQQEAQDALDQTGVSTHDDPDPQDHIDTAVSSRSSHDWDPQGRIDMPISEAGGGVDWATKTPGLAGGFASATDSDIVSVSGSGYVIGFGWKSGSRQDSLRLTVDGSDRYSDTIHQIAIPNTGGSTDGFGGWVPVKMRFESSVALGIGVNLSSSSVHGGLSYVLD